VRWVVDAMNVIGSRPDGWWRDRRGAIEALVARLETWAPDGDRVTVVLERPPQPPIGAQRVRVVHAPTARPDSADDEIVRLLEVDRQPSEITVVTSDAALVARVRALGAQVCPSSRFRALLDG
jgi:predicted RNA-binding protein with PIN domain